MNELDGGGASLLCWLVIGSGGWVFELIRFVRH